ncbi:MAG: hypothetical protein WCH65_03610 [bacterium]
MKTKHKRKYVRWRSFVIKRILPLCIFVVILIVLTFFIFGVFEVKFTDMTQMVCALVITFLLVGDVIFHTAKAITKIIFD